MYPNADPKERGTYRSPKPPQKLKNVYKNPKTKLLQLNLEIYSGHWRTVKVFLDKS